jgi:hypothetical protein
LSQSSQRISSPKGIEQSIDRMAADIRDIWPVVSAKSGSYGQVRPAPEEVFPEMMARRTM